MTALPLLVHQTILYTFAILSISANCLLLLLVAHSSSRNFGQYRVLLCTFAVMDIVISLFHAKIIPIFLQAEFGFVVFSLRTLYFPDRLGYALLELYCDLFYEPFILLTFHFFYRLMSVVNPEALHAHFTKGIMGAMIVNAAVSMMVVADDWMLYPDIQEDFFAEILMSDYGVDLTRTPKPNIIPVHYFHTSAFGGDLNWHAIFSMVNAGGICFAMIAFNAFCSVYIMRAVNDRTISASARHFQMQLLRALVVQFTVPMIFCVMPFFLIVGLPATGFIFGQQEILWVSLSRPFPSSTPFVSFLLILDSEESSLDQFVSSLLENTL